ncbi:MAG TPA: MAPEG family protein [Sphingomicrobium sp.]|nr:MAPEG family protein [Sphingomicrobium sp.]
MPYSPILVPVVALVAWTLLMQVWMYATRFAAMKRAGISLKGRVGTRGGALEGAIPDEANWKAHNYNHLMEQPTIFYAIALTLALMGFGDGINFWLAWGYVGLRIVHSILQATVNVVTYRFLVFTLASLCLLGLTTHAALRMLHDCGILHF